MRRPTKAQLQKMRRAIILAAAWEAFLEASSCLASLWVKNDKNSSWAWAVCDWKSAIRKSAFIIASCNSFSRWLVLGCSPSSFCEGASASVSRARRNAVIFAVMDSRSSSSCSCWASRSL